ncbi:MAG: ankyrin repeat domain-containing protein [Sphingobacteriales bacterium]|nr:MAG: ankyrin repeat domain-containing protein [Sphingobacteriales bacterium]
MNYPQRIITDIEIHSVEGIKECFENGVSPNDIYKGKPLIYELLSGYLRSPNFQACVRTFVEYGLEFSDKMLLAVLLNDAVELDFRIKQNPEAVFNNYTFDAAFTPIYKASLLHICTEFNHLNCAKVLVENGLDVNIKAGIDEYGFGGQAPVFHTVNQHNNECLSTLEFLISQNVDLNYTIKGLIWGKAYPWETFIPAINPISYAMMGLLPQFQRKENDIYQVVQLMMRSAFDIDYKPENIPNKYLYK